MNSKPAAITAAVVLILVASTVLYTRHKFPPRPSLAELCAIGAPAGNIEPCRKALAANPDDKKSREHLIQYLVAVRNYDAFIEVYRDIAVRKPKDPEAHFDLAASFGFLRRYAEAIGPLETAIRLDPNEIKYRRLAQILYVQLGRKKDAFRAMRTAARLGDASSMYDLVWQYEDGIGVGSDEAQAFLWAERAARAGHIGAMDLMVKIYREGLYGQKIDAKKARHWAEIARRARQAP